MTKALPPGSGFDGDRFYTPAKQRFSGVAHRVRDGLVTRRKLVVVTATVIGAGLFGPSVIDGFGGAIGEDLWDGLVSCSRGSDILLTWSPRPARVGYLASSGEGDDIYPLYSDEVSPGSVGYYSECCSAQLVVQNQGDDSTVFTEIEFSASDIARIEVPELRLWPRSSNDNVLGDSGNSGAYMTVANHGWGWSRNGCVTVFCGDPAFMNVFGWGSREFDIPDLGPGESIVISVVGSEDVVAPTVNSEDIGDVSVSVSYESDDPVEGELVDTANEMGIAVWGDSVSWLGLGGMGNGATVFGIFVDSSASSHEWSEGIVETVEAHSSTVLPICFFPDQSCTMRYKLTLVDSKDRRWSTPVVEAEFDVDSYYSDVETIDATSLSVEELSAAILRAEAGSSSGGGQVAVSFPWGRG